MIVLRAVEDITRALHRLRIREPRLPLRLHPVPALLLRGVLLLLRGHSVSLLLLVLLLPEGDGEEEPEVEGALPASGLRRRGSPEATVTARPATAGGLTLKLFW